MHWMKAKKNAMIIIEQYSEINIKCWAPESTEGDTRRG